MNTSGKATEWLVCFSIVNLMTGCFLLEQLENSMNLVPCRKQLECHRNILNKINVC